MTSEQHEALLEQFKDKEKLQTYKERYDNLPTSFFPRFLAKILFGTVDVIYGKKPTIKKFKVLEVVARVPYQTWEFANYLLTTNFYTNEEKVLKYAMRSDFGKFAQDNETMHVVVISQIAKEHCKQIWLIHTFLPIVLAYIYFGISTILYLVSSRYSYELNYLFENHAYNQYEWLIKDHADELAEKPLKSKFLDFYGRPAKNQLEFFEAVKNDEIIHRNQSAIEMVKDNDSIVSEFVENANNSNHDE